MAILFLSYNVDKANMSTKRSSFCTTTKIDAQKDVNPG